MLMIRSAMPFTSVSLRKQPRNHSEQDWNTPTLQSPPPVIENQPLHMEGPHREINEEIGSWESCFFLLKVTSFYLFHCCWTLLPEYRHFSHLKAMGHSRMPHGSTTQTQIKQYLQINQECRDSIGKQSSTARKCLCWALDQAQVSGCQKNTAPSEATAHCQPLFCQDSCWEGPGTKGLGKQHRLTPGIRLRA